MTVRSIGGAHLFCARLRVHLRNQFCPRRFRARFGQLELLEKFLQQVFLALDDVAQRTSHRLTGRLNGLCQLLDTLARALHATGDSAAALARQRDALALVAEDDPQRGEYESFLQELEMSERVGDKTPAR